MAAGALVMAGAAWLWNELEVVDSENRIYIQAGVAVGVIVVLGGLLSVGLEYTAGGGFHDRHGLGDA